MDREPAHCHVKDGPSSSSHVKYLEHHLPVEVFDQISLYLSREDFKSLRLVSRCLYNQTRNRFFRNLVVPFRFERDRFSTWSLFARNGIIFDEFGPKVKRFAISFELGENHLSFVPAKSLLKAVPAHWGIYRWPSEGYSRVDVLESLGRITREHKEMRSVMNRFHNVAALGLACDAGLGFLSGPDPTTSSTEQQPHPIFSPMYGMHEQYMCATPLVIPEGLDIASILDTDFERFRPMLESAGYGEHQLRDAFAILAHTTNTQQPQLRQQDTSTTQDEAGGSRTTSSASSDASQDGVDGSVPVISRDVHRLVPTSLTTLQKELLLEFGRVLRAMIQSFVDSIIDLRHTGRFNNVTNLNIAKIPSSFLVELLSTELWDALISLDTVAFGVVADWRRISSDSEGEVMDEDISPTGAVLQAFRLLDTYVGRQPNIRTVHFEWIGGGEHAPGVFQRHHYVLPAPILPLAEGNSWLANRPLLSLPRVKKLSLKNCYVVPHMWKRFVGDMLARSLERLDLDSVSLSGPIGHRERYLYAAINPPHPNFWLWPAVAKDAAIRAAGGDNEGDGRGGVLSTITLQGNLALLAIRLPATQTTLPEAQIADRDIRTSSWSDFLERFSPGRKMEALASSQPTEANTCQSHHVSQRSDILDQQPHAKPLKTLMLRSCGYVYLEQTHIDDAALTENCCVFGSSEPLLPDAFGDGLKDSMQRLRDSNMGMIFPHLRAVEMSLLQTKYGMTIGGDGVFSEAEINAAIQEGCHPPGKERFSGLLELK